MASQGVARASPVGTTRSFNGSPSTLNNAIIFGVGLNMLTITYNGLPPGNTVDANPTTFSNLGQFVVSTTRTGAAIGLGKTFALTINQTVPGAGSGTFTSTTFIGLIAHNSSRGMVQFSLSSVTIAGVTYSVF